MKFITVRLSSPGEAFVSRTFEEQMMLRCLGLLVMCCVFWGSAVTAQAAVTTYTDQSTWAAAAGSSSVETFESAATGNTVGPTTYTKSLTDFSIAVTLPDSSDYADVYSSSGAASLGSGNYFGWSGNATGGSSPTGEPTFIITFAAARKAVAFDWKNTDGSDYYKVVIDGVTYTQPPLTPSSSGFWGIVSDTSFTTLSFSAVYTGGVVSAMGIDNVRYGAASGGSGSSVPFPVWAIGFLAVVLVSVRLLAARKR